MQTKNPNNISPNLPVNEDEATKFMSLAIQLAEENVLDGTGGPFGAVVVKNGEIIAASANTVTVTNDPTAHAEVAAIRLACEKLNTYSLEGCEIYASCEPCPMCLGAIYWARIDKLYYGATKTDAAHIGFDDDFIYKELDLKPENRKIFTSQMMHKEALSPFKLWEETEGKKEY